MAAIPSFSTLVGLLKCPITQETMIDPYIAMPCGHSFEKVAIDEWFRANPQHICPLDKHPIARLTPNRSLKDAVEEIKRMEESGSSTSDTGLTERINALRQQILRISPPSDLAQLDQITQLFEACQEGDLVKLTPLLNADLILGAKRVYDPSTQLDIEKCAGWTLLHEAAFHGHIPIMEALYRTAPMLLITFRADQFTALHAAALGGHFEALQWLYDKRHNLIDNNAAKKFTPLHAALIGKNRRAIAWLIETWPKLLELKPYKSKYPLGQEKAVFLLDVLTIEHPVAKELDLRDNLLTFQVGPHLNIYLMGSTTIQTLLLGNNHLGDNGLEAMEVGLQTAPLVILNLKFTQLTDAGAVILARVLRSSPTIKEVDLSTNFISDVGAIALADAIIHNTTLTSLTLFNNQITDRGARAWAAALRQRTIPLTLSLIDNQLTDSVKAELTNLAPHKVTT